MTKKFSIPCNFNGQKAPFIIYLGSSEEHHHPLHFQADWLNKARGGQIPQEIMEAISKLKDLAEKNNVSFEELCVYALGSAAVDEEEAINKARESAATSAGASANSPSYDESAATNFAETEFDKIDDEYMYGDDVTYAAAEIELAPEFEEALHQEALHQEEMKSEEEELEISLDEDIFNLIRDSIEQRIDEEGLTKEYESYGDQEPAIRGFGVDRTEEFNRKPVYDSPNIEKTEEGRIYSWDSLPPPSVPYKLSNSGETND